MRYLKFGILGLGVLGAMLSLGYGVHNAGVHGVIVIIGCALPAGLAAYGTFVQPTMRRWSAIVSAVSFLIVGMKTSEGNDDIQNIMLAAFLGILISIALAIRPERTQ